MTRHVTSEFIASRSRWKFLFGAVYHFEYDGEREPAAPSGTVIAQFCRQHGVPVSDAHPSLHLDSNLIASVRKLLAARGVTEPFAAIHAGPSWPVKEWPREYWVGLVQELGTRGPAQVVQLGNSRHVQMGAATEAAIPGATSFVNELTLAESFAVISLADLFVGIDSGLLHAAACLRKPAVGLFGATSPDFLFPANSSCSFVVSPVECQGCHHRIPRLHWMTGCPYSIRCMTAISKDSALNLCLPLLHSRSAPLPSSHSPISIVIRTFNSAGTLSMVLERLHLAADDEIIIVDSGSTDATLEIARSFHARIIQAKGAFNYSRSLNLGFSAARNPWVLSLSSHCLPQPPDLLKSFREALGKLPENVAVVYGNCSLVELEENPPAPITFATVASSTRELLSVFSGNAVGLYRREYWLNQPFDETLPTGEDLAWLQKALARSMTAARVPRAAVLYRNPASLARMFKKGWEENRMEIMLLGPELKPTLRNFALRLASLGKKCAKGKITMSFFLQHAARNLGAYLSPKFGSDRGPGPVQSKDKLRP
ncbi:MAG: glycosyltransferase family 9 protein [Verrucomicrobiota bacterium]